MFFSHSFHSVHKYDTNNNESGFYDVRWLRIGILLHHSEHKWIIHSSTSSVAYVTTNIAVAVMMYDDNKVLVLHKNIISTHPTLHMCSQKFRQPA